MNPEEQVIDNFNTSERVEQKFDSKEIVTAPFSLLGVLVDTVNNIFNFHQRKYKVNFNQLSTSAEFQEFWSLRHQLAWLSYCRPNIVAGINILSQVKELNFKNAHAEEVNKILRHLQSETRLGISFTSLYINSLPMVVCMDYSFTNTEDLSSQIVSIVFFFRMQEDYPTAWYLAVENQDEWCDRYSVAKYSYFHT